MKQCVLDSASSSKGMKKHVQIILVVVSVVVVLISAIRLFVMRKVKQGKRKEELKELLMLEGYTEGYELENGGSKSHDLRLFSYASIQSATRKFSPRYKLGQGGFGPIYKGKTPEGQDIAVKVLSRQSGQGLLEFKTELILISKLQHVNLVKLLGFCIHGDDKMIIYDYIGNISLDFFLFSLGVLEKRLCTTTNGSNFEEYMCHKPTAKMHSHWSSMCRKSCSRSTHD